MKKIKVHKITQSIIILLFLTGYYSLYAQSDNYWSWNFNTPSVLLGGSVVGGSAGSTAVFYNPSLIDNDSLPALSISANIVSLQFFNAENIAGDGIDADKFNFKIQPRFVSYIFPTKNEKLGMATVILSPVSEEINFTIQHIDEIDVIQRTAGLETYTGYLKYSRKYDDTWVGAGLSYELSENFAVGVSSFISIKTMKYTYEQQAQAYQETDSVRVDNHLEAKYIAQSNFKEELKYWNLSFIFKLGAQYKTNNDRISLGLNLTFPNIPFFGEGDIRKSYSRSDVYDNQADIFTANGNFIGYEEKVKSHVKSPFSIALGVQYFTKNRKNFISLTGEYFSSIDPYSIVSISDTPNNLSDIIDGNAPLVYSSDARSVTNLGIGFKQTLSPSLFILSGLRTDFSVASKDEFGFAGSENGINRIHFDKYHLSVGPVLKIKKFKVITGIQYTYGRNKEMQQIVNFSDPVEYIPAINQSLLGKVQNNANASINEFALFLGMTVDL